MLYNSNWAGKTTNRIFQKQIFNSESNRTDGKSFWGGQAIALVSKIKPFRFFSNNMYLQPLI